MNSLATDDLIIQSSAVSKCNEIQILLTTILEEMKGDYSYYYSLDSKSTPLSHFGFAGESRNVNTLSL